MAASGLPQQPEIIARWLYRFGTVPCGLTAVGDFGPGDDPLAVLSMTVGGVSRRLLETAYEPTTLDGWYSFAHNSAKVWVTPACKLYVSPRPEALADAFPHIVDTFVRCDVRSFKVGRGIEGLLRPDKIIAYFEDHEQMTSVARMLEHALYGLPVQGVPFTTDTGGDGMLSSGIDPPPGIGAVSWRSWVTKRLAASLASQSSSEWESAVAAALDDIRTAGVDPDRWEPSANTVWEA